MAAKLKGLKINSVDLVDRGANQDAYITLFKRDYSQDNTETAADDTVQKQQPETVDESEQQMNLFKRLVNWWWQIFKSTEMQENSKEVIDTMKIDKSKMTPEDAKALEELEKKYGTDAPEDVKKAENETAGNMDENTAADVDTVGKSVSYDSANTGVIGNDSKADESAIEKRYQEQIEKQNTEIAELRKMLEVKELEGVAKKYEILGKNSGELADKLYELRKANKDFYNDYIAALDGQLDAVEKSGMFDEIGSNRQGSVGAETSINLKASELRKSAPDMANTDSIIKAWEENPELAAEYEKNYRR